MSVSKSSFFVRFFVLKLFQFSLKMELDQKSHYCDLMDLMLSSYLKFNQGIIKFFQMNKQDYIVLRAVLESFFLKILSIFELIQALHLIELCLFFHQNLNLYYHLLDLIFLSIFDLINDCLSS